VLFLPPYQVVLSTSWSFAGAADIAGLKIRTIGGGMDLMIRALGGVPVRMAPPVIHESMSRGTIDGTMLPYQSIVSYGLYTLVKSGSLNENFGTPVVTAAVAVPPLIVSFGPEQAERRAGDQVALDVESVVDGGVAGQETLG